MEKIISDRRDVIQADLAKDLLKLAFQEMTKSKVMRNQQNLLYTTSQNCCFRIHYIRAAVFIIMMLSF